MKTQDFEIKGFKTGKQFPVSVDAKVDTTPYNHKYSPHFKGRKDGYAIIESMTQETLKNFYNNPKCAYDPVFILMNTNAKKWNCSLSEATYRYMADAFRYAIKFYEDQAKTGEMIRAGKKRD